MAKIDVNGADEHPVYSWLKNQKAGILGIKMIKWNFEVGWNVRQHSSRPDALCL